MAQPKQGAWTRWENTKNGTITWNDIKQMEPKQLGFLIKAVYDITYTSKFKTLGVKYIQPLQSMWENCVKNSW